MYQPDTVPENSTARILIVDDEAAQMKALCDTLQDEGYTTQGFISGEAALAELKKTKFDLLLADLMMPGMDGITLFRAALKTDSDLVGVIMTGEGTIATAVEAMKTGVLDYILKPFKLSIILPLLSRALAVRKLRLENVKLEQQVRERTAELEAANKELEAVNKELEAFSYSVSHDLRAPLRHINGFSQALLEDYAYKLNEEGRDYLQEIRSATQEMAQLIDDMLQLARVTRSEMRREVVNLSELAQSVVDELRKRDERHTVTVQIEQRLLTHGDERLLRAMLSNLLGNAWKFSSKQEQPEIVFGHEQKNGEAVYFVRDNGAGFDMAFADKLFTAFQRLHTANEFEGTGIGLAIVQRIINRHGGRVRAEGAVNQGATFYFTLPDFKGERI